MRHEPRSAGAGRLGDGVAFGRQDVGRDEDLSQANGGVMKRTLLLLWLVLGVVTCVTPPLSAQDLVHGALTAMG